MDNSQNKTARPELVSIVIPAYNEEDVLRPCYERLQAILAAIPDCLFEIVFVNDGSVDRTQEIIDELCERDERITSIDLSRNFGKEAAMTAGLDHAVGDAVVIIDADLQDPPELIPRLIAEWRSGYEVVYGKRTHRDGESWLKKSTAAMFYRAIRVFSRVEIPADTGDFRLMSRCAVDALRQLREQHRFMKGLFAWVGFRSKPLEYRRDPRLAGQTKFSYWKLWNFALEGITSFTIAPLKIASYLGLFIALAAFFFGAWVVLRTIFFGEPVRGYPTILVTILMLGGAQLFFIGILGEYLGRVFGETKRRPLYLIQKIRKAKAQHATKEGE